MKKGFLLIIAVMGMMLGNLNAQSKFGYVNATEILYLMPEMKNVEHVLDSFEQALGVMYQKDIDEYTALLEKLEQAQKDGKSESYLKLIQDDIIAKQDYLKKAELVYQEELVEKQTKLLTPLNDKILAAIKDVAKEKGLNYIFDIGKGALLFWDEAGDVSKDVKEKLGIDPNATLQPQ